MIDLHTHSNASDGSYSPSSLIEEAAKRGISALALTDHDTTKGLEEAAEAARERGVQFIPGIEIEITRKQETLGDFHLLGLGINPSPEFKAAIEELARLREERNLEMVDRMNKAGIAASYDEVRAMAFSMGSKTSEPEHRERSIGRPHFAAFLVKRKLVKNIEQAFFSYLGRGKPFYIPKAGLEFEQAAELIHESGGIAVLAHPMSLYVAWGKLPDFIKNLKDIGLDGLEAWHPIARVSACRRLQELGEKLGLCVTAGSDFHGETRPGRKLGITAGGKRIDEVFLDGIPLFS